MRTPILLLSTVILVSCAAGELQDDRMYAEDAYREASQRWVIKWCGHPGVTPETAVTTYEKAMCKAAQKQLDFWRSTRGLD